MINKKAGARFLLYLILVIVLFRVGGDIFLFVLHTFSPMTPSLWKTFTSLLLTFTLFIFLFRGADSLRPSTGSDLPTEYFRELKFILLFIFILLVSKSLVLDNPQSMDHNILALIYGDLLAMYTIFISIYFFRFFYKWQNNYRHSRTRVYIKIIYVCIILLIILFPIFDSPVVNITGDRIPEDVRSAIRAITLLVLIVLMFCVLLISKKNDWIAVLPKKKKLNFLFMVLLAFILLIAFDIGHDNSDSLHKTLYVFSPFCARFIYITVFILSVYFIRIILTTLGSLPTAEIVEHQTHEIQSLTYLSRVLAANRDINTIIESVTEMALRASSGSAAWLEKYNGGEKPELVSVKFITETAIRDLYEHCNLDTILRNLKEPALVESVPEDRTLLSNTSVFSLYAKSMIAVPIYANNNRFGSLVVFHPEEYGFNIERLKVLASFNDNIAIAIENTRLIADSIEKEKYRKELKLARDMQLKLLPQKLPSIANYEISAYAQPAEEVGGDFYDIFQLKNGKYCILIGDVSGKGISAAFYMAQLKGIVLAIAKESGNATEVLCKLNDTLHGNMDKRMYITLTALIIEDSKGNITIARAGHLPAFLVSGPGCVLIQPPGIGLGLTSNSFFCRNIEESKVALSPNDAFVLITDGVNEARNNKNEELGLNNLKQFLENRVYRYSGEYIEGINAYVTGYMEGNIQLDDITIISLVYKGES